MNVSSLLDFPPSGNVVLSDPKVRRAIFEHYGRIDFWTRAPLDYARMHLDHIIPRSKGGPDNIYNIVPCDKRTNISKGCKADDVAATAVLALIRTVYVPRLLKDLEKPSRSAMPSNTATTERRFHSYRLKKSSSLFDEFNIRSKNEPDLVAVGLVDRPFNVQQIEMLEAISEPLRSWPKKFAVMCNQIDERDDHINMHFSAADFRTQAIVQGISASKSHGFKVLIRHGAAISENNSCIIISATYGKKSADLKLSSLLAEFLQLSDFDRRKSFYETGSFAITTRDIPYILK